VTRATTSRDNKTPRLQSAAEAGRLAALAHVFEDHAHHNEQLITSQNNLERCAVPSPAIASHKYYHQGHAPHNEQHIAAQTMKSVNL
jgi:hypothetical protein